jgi:hypothetical protein
MHFDTQKTNQLGIYFIKYYQFHSLMQSFYEFHTSKV